MEETMIAFEDAFDGRISSNLYELWTFVAGRERNALPELRGYEKNHPYVGEYTHNVVGQAQHDPSEVRDRGTKELATSSRLGCMRCAVGHTSIFPEWLGKCRRDRVFHNPINSSGLLRYHSRDHHYDGNKLNISDNFCSGECATN
jgi:hypothetical protein